MSNEIAKLKKKIKARKASSTSTTYGKPQSSRRAVTVANAAPSSTKRKTSAPKTLREIDAVADTNMSFGTISPQGNGAQRNGTQDLFGSINPTAHVNPMHASAATAGNIVVNAHKENTFNASPETEDEEIKHTRFSFPATAFAALSGTSVFGATAGIAALSTVKLGLLQHIVTGSALSATTSQVLTTFGLTATKAMAVIGGSSVVPVAAAAGAVGAVAVAGYTYVAIKFPKTTFALTAAAAAGAVGAQALVSSSAPVALKLGLLKMVVTGGSLTSPAAALGTKALATVMGLAATNPVAVMAVGAVVAAGAAYGAYKLGRWAVGRIKKRRALKAANAATVSSSRGWFKPLAAATAFAAATFIHGPSGEWIAKARNTASIVGSAVKSIAVSNWQSASQHATEATTKARAELSTYATKVVQVDGPEALMAKAGQKTPDSKKQPPKPEKSGERAYAFLSSFIGNPSVMDDLRTRKLVAASVQDLPMLAGLKRGTSSTQSNNLFFLRKYPQKFGVMGKMLAIANFDVLKAKFTPVPKQPSNMKFIPQEIWPRLAKQWKTATQVNSTLGTIEAANARFECAKVEKQATTATAFYLDLADDLKAVGTQAAIKASREAMDQAARIATDSGLAVAQKPVGLKAYYGRTVQMYNEYLERGDKNTLTKAVRMAAIAQQLKPNAQMAAILNSDIAKRTTVMHNGERMSLRDASLAIAPAAIAALKREQFGYDRAWLAQAVPTVPLIYKLPEHPTQYKMQSKPVQQRAEAKQQSAQNGQKETVFNGSVPSSWRELTALTR